MRSRSPKNSSNKNERDEFATLEEAAADLVRLDRHEQRCWSQQKRAIQNFMSLRMFVDMTGVDGIGVVDRMRLGMSGIPVTDAARIWFARVCCMRCAAFVHGRPPLMGGGS